jgi:hypothetical protein
MNKKKTENIKENKLQLAAKVCVVSLFPLRLFLFTHSNFKQTKKQKKNSCHPSILGFFFILV